MRLKITVLAVAVLLAGCGEEEQQTTASGGGGGDFPVTIEHKFGETVVPDRPERVVAVGFNDQDFALALGVKPVGARQFQGGIDVSRRPWAADALGGSQPEIIGAEEIEFEKIAALRPDLILGVYSGLTEDDYETLSKIAPTVAQSDEYPDFGEPWDEQTEVTAEALGMPERGTEVVSGVEDRLERVREEHPELQGKTFVLAAVSGGKVFVYSSGDLRSQFFTSLGMEVPAEVDELAGKSFFAELSGERLRLLDQDVLVVYGDEKSLSELPLADELDVLGEGRVVYLSLEGDDFANAVGFSSPLSLPFAVEEGVPMLTAAVDGDPATKVSR